MSEFENMNGNDILAQSLWNNKFVKVKSKSLYTMSIVRKGIKQLMISLSLRDPLKIGELLARNFI